MEKNKKISDFVGGWVVGDFEPTLHKTNDVEVSVKYIPKDTIGDGHYHKLGDEFTIILEGQAEDNGRIYNKGDIILLKKMQRNYTKFLQDSMILSIKTISQKGDKYY